MVYNKVDLERLIDKYCSKGKLKTLNLDNTNLWNGTDGVAIAVSNILRNKYRGIILQSCLEIDIQNDNLFRKYMYSPKLLSLDLYGTMELWHVLLWLNNMISITQFNRRRILIYDPGKMDILIQIMSKEDNRIETNHDDALVA